MIVTAASSAITLPIASTSDASKATLNYDSFLKLLIATMKNQDPTQPNDPAQTMSQLASFSGVEQNIKTNSKLDSLLAIAAGSQAGALIGKTVTNADGTVKGTITAIEIGKDGIIATLEDGRRLAIGTGVTVSAA